MRYFTTTHIRYFPCIQNRYFFKCLYKHAYFCEVYLDLKKVSMVCSCCHFKWTTYILLSFSGMSCILIMYAWANSNGLFMKNAANGWACYWASTKFIIGGSLSSTSKEVQGLCIKVRTRWLYYLYQGHIDKFTCNLQLQWCLHLPLSYNCKWRLILSKLIYWYEECQIFARVVWSVILLIQRGIW